MKSKITVFAALLCAFGSGGAFASDCLWDDCNIGPVPTKTMIQKPTPLPVAETPVIVATEYEYVQTPRMVNAHAISVKPSVPDDRMALWDGTHGEYNARAGDKTVDWRDGVPIWDDSISNYKTKDFRDWFIEPAPVIYLGDQTSMPIMDEVIATRARVEELLVPYKPKDSLWINDNYNAQDLSHVVRQTFSNDVLVKEELVENEDGCPFETDAECDIWRRKPMVRETVSPRSPKIRTAKMDEFLNAICINPNINANAAAAAPLLERYKMLMQSARACCTDGMVYELKHAGASDGLIYKFLSDDANFYHLGDRCLMMSDADFDKDFPNTATASVAADVRNGCLCRGRDWFNAMLAPFADAYKSSPSFANSNFNYTYTDGLQRETTVSINHDVKNVLDQLELCP